MPGAMCWWVTGFELLVWFCSILFCCGVQQLGRTTEQGENKPSTGEGVNMRCSECHGQ